MANHLAMAAILEPDDEVLIEQPTYELLTATARYFTPHIQRFHRQEENGFALDPAAVERAVSPRTRLIVITNLHNPSSALASESDLRAIGDIANRVGARVLVDEVYLDAVYENTPASSVHYGPRFVVTSSLTKVYGLSGLRCGWILAEPELAEKMWRLNDLFGSIPAFPAEQLSAAAFANLGPIRGRAKRIVDADRASLTEFLDATPAINAVRTPWGTTCFPKLLNGDIDAFIARLRNDFDTSVVPGAFFEMPDRFRIGMGVDHAMFVEGLRRIGRALVP
jgi:aspartate/methionine/tyrosine aminotransferase